MFNVAEVQEAIRQLDHGEQEHLRIWLNEQSLAWEDDGPELEAKLLKAVQGPHSPLIKADLEAGAARTLRDHRARRSA